MHVIAAVLECCLPVFYSIPNFNLFVVACFTYSFNKCKHIHVSARWVRVSFRPLSLEFSLFGWWDISRWAIVVRVPVIARLNSLRIYF